ncbi:conjugal transfer protein TraH [Legionella sp. 28fT52]|uniref:conjugal transfer protein TraH n=1 Tax=Legionella sp. 28fT52 TaxID=3410134 RepID=UPI003AF5D669
MRAFLLAALLLCQISVYAGIESDLNHFFDGVGMASNVTSPAAFESQAAGFFGAGSLYARGAVRQYQLVQLDLPSYRAGCGGIDLHLGSLSFLSEQKLVDLGKAVMTNTGAYAVDVMLASTVPELKQVRDYLQQLQQMANQASINSCQLSQNLVGGVYPKTAESQQKICKDQAAMGKEGLFSDYAKARNACADSGFHQVMDKAEKDPERQKQVVINKNIVWSILKEKSFLSLDTELAEMVMSLTGTLIIDREGKVTHVPSLATSPQFIQTLLTGGQGAKRWQCDEKTKCLKVKLVDFTLPESATLVFKVRTMIERVNAAIVADTLDDKGIQGILANFTLPVLKFLTVLHTSEYASLSVDMEEYAGLIAHDLLTHYLNGLLSEVAASTAGSEMNESLLHLIEKRIREAKGEVMALNPRVSHLFAEKMALIENIARIEKQVAATMATS